MKTWGSILRDYEGFYVGFEVEGKGMVRMDVMGPDVRISWSYEF
jgi:hypothetical protein